VASFAVASPVFDDVAEAQGGGASSVRAASE
jgi:hypothetical protein